MVTRQASAVRAHRRRQSREGYVRVEVKALQQHAQLIRDMAKAINDDGGVAERLRAVVEKAAPRSSERTIFDALACDDTYDLDRWIVRDRRPARPAKL